MQGQQGRPARFGSQVIAATPSDDSSQAGPSHQPDGPPSVLRLRGAAPRNAPRVQWDEDVVDNEGLGKKKSKICCIYHKPKAFDESSSDDSSSDSSNDDSSADDNSDDSAHEDGEANSRPGSQGDTASQEHSCGHKHHRRKGKGKKHKHRKGGGSGSMVEIDKGKRNAYETQPGKE